MISARKFKEEEPIQGIILKWFIRINWDLGLSVLILARMYGIQMTREKYRLSKKKS